MAHKTKKSPPAQPKNLSLPPHIIAMGERLAKEDGRTFSAQVAHLIRQAAERMGITAS
jgi:hypothetical protein